MFRVFIDDSGTDPNQQIAIATAFVVPAKRIVALDMEFDRLKQQEGFTDFHMSLCVARNQHSEFADWTDEKQQRVISRVRQIGKKFGAQAMSLAVTKDDYDQLVPSWLRELAGKFHYTWAIRHMLDLLDQWSLDHNVTLLSNTFTTTWIPKHNVSHARNSRPLWLRRKRTNQDATQIMASGDDRIFQPFNVLMPWLGPAINSPYMRTAIFHLQESHKTVGTIITAIQSPTGYMPLA
jgi:hypothetical protein